MNNLIPFRLLGFCRKAVFQFQPNFPKNHFGGRNKAAAGVLGGAMKKKKMGKIGQAVEKTVLPVETDPKRLVQYVCGTNIFNEGEDIKLKPDNEYPDWLWDIRTGPPPPFETLDPNSMDYWRRVKKMARRQTNRIAKLRKF